MCLTCFENKHKHLRMLWRKLQRGLTPLGKPCAYREYSDLLEMKLRLLHVLNNNQVVSGWHEYRYTVAGQSWVVATNFGVVDVHEGTHVHLPSLLESCTPKLEALDNQRLARVSFLPHIYTKLNRYIIKISEIYVGFEYGMSEKKYQIAERQIQRFCA